jgi:hypothetical protein
MSPVNSHTRRTIHWLAVQCNSAAGNIVGSQPSNLIATGSLPKDCRVPGPRNNTNTQSLQAYGPGFDCHRQNQKHTCIGKYLDTLHKPPVASFIHSCYTCSRSSFEQRQPIPNATDHTKQQTDQTNKQRQLPSRVMSINVLCSLSNLIQNPAQHLTSTSNPTRQRLFILPVQLLRMIGRVSRNGLSRVSSKLYVRHMLLWSMPTGTKWPWQSHCKGPTVFCPTLNTSARLQKALGAEAQQAAWLCSCPSLLSWP